MKRATILLLINTFDMGGAEAIYIQVARGLAERGYRVIAGCLQRRSGQVAVELERSGIEILDLRMSNVGVEGVWRLVQFCRKNDVDVVYTFLIHAHLVGRMAARIAKVPVVISSQQAMHIENRLLKFANRFSARWCDALIAVSKNVEDYLVDEVGVPRAKVTTIFNAIDADRFVGITPRRFNDLIPGPHIGYCARLRPEKDHQALIVAVKMVKAQFPGVRLFLAGDGPERNRLERFVQSQGMTDSVEFLGHLSDVSSFYGRLDIYVQSSYIEGLPLAVLEALACGLPVVASRVAGNEEILGEREAGLLVEPHDPAALAEAIIWMTVHRQEARQMGANGQRIVRERFGAEAMIAATEDLLRKFTADRGQTHTLVHK
jgi:glycosyltransferase involved in cell wall biosynthesis